VSQASLKVFVGGTKGLSSPDDAVFRESFLASSGIEKFDCRKTSRSHDGSGLSVA
jgi:hypothetical protein